MLYLDETLHSNTHVNELDPFDEFVVAVKNERRRKLPFLRFALREVVRQLLAVLLVDVLERSEVAHDHLHLIHCLLDISLEHFGRIEMTPALTQQTRHRHSQLRSRKLFT